MSIIKSIQDSAEGWKMFFGGAAKFGGDTVNPEQGFYAPIKAGEVVQVSAQAPGGVRYIPATLGPSPQPSPNGRGGTGEGTQYDPGTPTTVIETIQKSIGDSAEGWRIGFASVAGSAKEAATGVQASIEKSLAGWQMGISEAGGKVSESFGNVDDWFKSTKWQMLLPIIILAFIAVMVAIGYSGLGAPAARVAEREYAKRR